MGRVTRRELQFEVSEKAGSVSAILDRPSGAHALLVMAHGAGAPMTHAFMENAASDLAERGIAVFRYQFPYTEKGSRRPDSRGTLLATVRAAVACAGKQARGLPLFAGGKSMGGRMTSLACADEALAGVRGIVFFGFPLHAAGKPPGDRADHLSEVEVPMLFLQGTRDALADLTKIRGVCRRLGDQASLHVVEGGDHSFAVLKRSGRAPEEVRAELADGVADFVARVAGSVGVS